MWLFTRYGFFSAVSARQGDGSHGQPVDLTRMMVRARRREHLESLLHHFANALTVRPDIHETESKDYRYRIFMPKAQWAAVLTAIGNDVDYDNFKDAAHEHLDATPAGRAYTHALSDVWEVMYELQV